MVSSHSAEVASHAALTSIVSPQENPEDLDRFREECAIFGLYLPPELHAVKLIYFALFNLQHRGQDASGIATTDGVTPIRLHKGLGLVAQVYQQHLLDKLIGHLGIGHNRYTTSQSNTKPFAQPQIEGQGKKKLALALNGNISNPEPMKQFLREQKINIEGKNDTMLMSALLWFFLKKTDDIVTAIEACWPYWIGAYSLVILWQDKLVGVRGPYGIRPLVLGKIGEGYALASESCAWNSRGELIRTIEPGEVVVIDQHGVSAKQIEKTPERLDAFELVYFARPDSEWRFKLPEGRELQKSYYAVRKSFGKALYDMHGITADVVVPVPDSACPAAEGYAEASGVPYAGALIKSRYVQRTFIQPSPEDRALAHDFKLNVVSDQVAGKEIILIDDSIVRGTTLGPLIKKLKAAGATKVSVMIAAPPVKYPDFYGIATHDQSELISAHKSPEEIAQHIGADGVYFLDIAHLCEAVGVPQECLMTSAFTGEYPVDIGGHAAKIMY